MYNDNIPNLSFSLNPPTPAPAPTKDGDSEESDSDIGENVGKSTIVMTAPTSSRLGRVSSD